MAGFSSWDDVPDLTLDGRSMVPYPDPDPEFTAQVWDRLRAEHAERDRRRAEKAEAPPEVYSGYEMPVITQAAREFDEPIRPLAGWVKLALANGWKLIKLAHALSTMRGKEFAGGEKAGTRRPDRDVELQWAFFEKAGVGRIAVSYPIFNGTVNGTGVARRFNGKSYSDADLRRIVKGEEDDGDA